jgi:glycogen debranching enzyme
MDAKIGDWVVTPRRGKPVEIQALWYNALRVMEDLARRFGSRRGRRHYRELADRAREQLSRNCSGTRRPDASTTSSMEIPATPPCGPTRSSP